jgi:hypothetical protein
MGSLSSRAAPDPSIIEAVHPQLGAMFACVDPDARFCRSAISQLKFAARLTPFRNRAAAVEALLEAGAGMAPQKEKGS